MSSLSDAARQLSSRPFPRRKLLKMSAGAGVSLAALTGLASQCGSSPSPASSAPTATTAPAAPPTTAPAVEPATAPATASAATPTTAAQEAPAGQLGNDKYPYGGSGVADRAIEGARALKLPSGMGLTFAYVSGASTSWTPLGKQFEKETGIPIKFVEITGDDPLQVIMQQAVAKSNDWDVVDFQCRGLGDLVSAGALIDVTDWMKKYKPDIDNPKWGQFEPAATYTVNYLGKYYGIMDDGDVFTTNYRKDWYDDPKEKEGFKAKYGHDMALDTWEQYREVAEWFTRPDQNMYGTADCRAKNFGFWWWEMMYASQGNPNWYYFDDDMKPLLNTPQGIAATKLYASFKAVQHPDVASWNWTAAYSAFTGGSQFSITTWPSLTKFALDPSTSKVVNKVGYALTPGTMVDGTLIRRSIYSYGHDLAAWAYSKNPEAAYLFAQYLTSPEVDPIVVQQPGVVDPPRISTAADARIVKAYSQDFLTKFETVFTFAVPDITLKGSGEYLQQLDTNIQECFLGNMSAEDAMKKTSDAWEDITDRVGRDEQKQAWKILKGFYPTRTTYA